jgi:hypothetical protein
MNSTNDKSAYREANILIKKSYFELNALLNDLKQRIERNKQKPKSKSNSGSNHFHNNINVVIFRDLLPNINIKLTEFILNFEKINSKKITEIINDENYKRCKQNINKKAKDRLLELAEQKSLNENISESRLVTLLITEYISDIVKIKALLNETFKNSVNIKINKITNVNNENLEHLTLSLATIREFIPEYKKKKYTNLVNEGLRGIRSKQNIKVLEKSVIHLLKNKKRTKK